MAVKNTYRAKNLFKRSGAKPEFIVLHDTAGNGGLGDVKYLAQDPEKRGVSVDYAIPKDGTIYELNPEPLLYYTAHAGRKTAFRGYTGPQVNRHSIGIEIGQTVKLSPYPGEQIKSVALLCRDLCLRFNLKKTDITTHAKIIQDGSRSDPRQFPWESFWAIFNLDNDSKEGESVYHTVVDGDTLWGLSVKYLTSIEKLKELNDMTTMSTVIRVGQRLKVKE